MLVTRPKNRPTEDGCFYLRIWLIGARVGPALDLGFRHRAEELVEIYLMEGESHGVVGYHFTTRDSLIHKAFKFYFGSFRELMADSGWNPEKKMSPEQIVNALAAMIAYEVENPKATLVEQEMILVAARNPELAELYRNWEKQGVEIFIAGLKASGYQNRAD